MIYFKMMRFTGLKLLVFVFVIGVLALGIGSLYRGQPVTAAPLPPPGPNDLALRGFLWSENLGSFISFCGGDNNTDCPGDVQYQVYVNNETGEFWGVGYLQRKL